MALHIIKQEINLGYVEPHRVIIEDSLYLLQISKFKVKKNIY